ncbi:MAG: hypothetical protein ABW039_08835 [Sphingobium sp.]
MTDRLELSVERRIDAPVDHVWSVMTDRIEDWFCPARGAPRRGCWSGGPADAA